MDDAELALLRRAHAASGKLLKGRAISQSEEAALRRVVEKRIIMFSSNGTRARLLMCDPGRKHPAARPCGQANPA